MSQKKPIANAHDKYFKEVFSGNEEVASFIRGSLKKEIAEKIDSDSLQIDNNSYIDEQLGEHFSDIVYTCSYKNGPPLKIALLFEHKSYVPDFPHLQLQRYIVNIQEANIKQQQAKKEKPELIPVLPIVIYHGAKEWNKKPLEDYYENYPAELLCYLAQFDYVLVDLNKYTNDEIKQIYDSLKLQIAFVVMRNIFDILLLLQQLPYIINKISEIFGNEKGLLFYKMTLIYLFSTLGKYHKNEIVEEIKTINQKGGDIAMTIAEDLIQTGYIKGIEKGIAKGREEGKIIEKAKNALEMITEGFETPLIIKITKLSELEVKLLTALYNQFEKKAIEHIKIAEGKIDMK